MPSLPAHEVREHFFVLGLVGEKTLDLASQCPKGVASLSEQLTPVDFLFSLCSVGIYTPKTVTYRCAA